MAELYLRVVLESAARFQQQLVHHPVLQVSLRHQGADAVRQVKVAQAVQVEDSVEPRETEMRNFVNNN